MAEIRVDGRTFWRHVQALCDQWRATREASDWNAADVLVLLNGAAPAGDSAEDPMRKKSVVVLSWLLGYEFTDTFALLTDKALFVLASPKKIQILSSLAQSRPSSAPKLELLARAKDWPAQKAQLLSAAKSSFSGKRLGIAVKDTHEGAFAKQCAELWTIAEGTPAPFEAVDVSAGLAAVLAVKDADEIALARLAATVATEVYRQKAVSEVETVIDENRTVTHEQLAETIDAAYSDSRVLGDRLSADLIDDCYSPVVQSGAGRFNFATDVASSRDTLHHTAIVLRLGARYKLYCANVARTLFVNSTKEHEAVYRVALQAHRVLVEALRPGATIAEAVIAARSYVEKTRPDLVNHLPKAFGHGMGIEFKETGLGLTPKNTNPVKLGMVFNVVMSFIDVPVSKPPSLEKDPKGLDKSFSLMVADTVVVSSDGNTVLTSKCPKEWKDVSYVLGDEDEAPAPSDKPAKKQDDQKKEKQQKKKTEDDDKESLSSDADGDAEDDDDDDDDDDDEDDAGFEGGSVVQTRLRGREEKPQSLLEAEKRKQHQIELARARMDEAKRRINGDAAAAPVKAKDTELANVRSYASPADMPADLGLTKIVVDAAHESVILPVFGMMVPFHIGMVKNVTARDDMLRINFATPVSIQLPTSVVAVAAAAPVNAEEGAGLFLREVTYRIADPRQLGATELQIKEVRKRLTAKMQDSKMQEVEPQEQLRLSRGGQNPRLTDLSVQPNLTSGKKTTGTLEAHSNGFRYTTNRGATLDVMYNNIRHAFFQPAEQELILLLHFHLKSPIMVGKKKTKDVQFYLEVMEVSTALDRQKAHYGDAEEVEEEQREREMRRRHTASFHAFAKKVEELVPGLEFDIPYRELGFYGAPGRGNVLLQPTVHALVNLTDTPPFVLCLDDVEIAHFERVSPQHTLRNFDLVFVFKDLSRPVVRINSVPTSESLDAVKNWLDSIDIKYYEGPTNLNWPHILQAIREDPKGFLESGGWSFLEPESDSEEEEVEEEGSDFDPEEYKAEEGSSSDDDFSADTSASEEEEAAAKRAAKEEEDEDDGESWSDLEEEANDADSKKKRAQRDADDDEEDDVDEDEGHSHKKPKK